MSKDDSVDGVAGWIGEKDSLAATVESEARVQQRLDFAEFRLKKEVVPSRIQQRDREDVLSRPEKFSVRRDIEVTRLPRKVGRRPGCVESRIGSVVSHVEHADSVQIDDDAVVELDAPTSWLRNATICKKKYQTCGAVVDDGDSAAISRHTNRY